MPVKQHPPSRAPRSATALFALGLILGALPAAAAPAGRTPTPTPPPRGAAAWTAAESEPANCTQSRRKLWQAGEGWVVKTVTVCR